MNPAPAVPLPGPLSNVICTFTGRYFNLESPLPGQVDIRDIAWALSNICRFGGHSLGFYSVAQHSVLVSRIVPPAAARAGLLHDAVEAYFGDVVKPLKNLLPDYRRLEAQAEAVIMRKLGVDAELEIYHEEIKRADMIALATEKRDITAAAHHDWGGLDGVAPLATQIVPLAPQAAFNEFLLRWKEVG